MLPAEPGPVPLRRRGSRRLSVLLSVLLSALGACGGGAGAAGGGTGGGGAGTGDGGGGAGGAPGVAGRPFVYAGGGSTISTFALDPATGTLTARGMAPAGRSASYLAWDAGARRLFASNEQTPGSVLAFSIDQATGALTRVNEAPSGGDGPVHIAVDRSGQWLLAANYESGTVTTLPVAADGRLGGVAGRFNFGARSMSHMAAVDPSNRFVVVPCKGLDQLGVLRLDAVSGALTPNDPPFVTTAAAARPRHLAFHPTGRFAYAINELANTMDAYTYDGATGRLSPIQTLPTVPAGSTVQSFAAAVAVHPSGKFLYGSNRGHDSIVIYALGADGRMTLVGHETGGGAITMPRSFAVEPNGRFLLVGNQAGTTGLLVFRIDPGRGALTRVGNLAPSGPVLYVGILYLP